MKYNKILYESISLYIYKKQRNKFFNDNVEKLSLKDFFSFNKYDNNKYYFIDTKFFLSKILIYNNIESYNKLLKLIEVNLKELNKNKLNIIFDYLPLRFFGKEFLTNNYFFFNFKKQDKLNFFLTSNTKKKYPRDISVQVIISRLNFLDDVFLSILNQSLDIREIYFFINFKERKNIADFEKKFLKYFKYEQDNLILSYGIKEYSESEIRFFMPSNSDCQYILPLDDDDFLDINCLFEVKTILKKYGDFSLIKGLYKGINDKEGFNDIKNITKNKEILQKINYELNRRKGKYLFPNNLSSLDQLYVYNCDILEYYEMIVPRNIINNTGIEIELFLKAEELGGYFLIEKELYFKRSWTGQVTNNFYFQKELFNYVFDLLNITIKNRNIDKYVKIDLFPYIDF